MRRRDFLRRLAGAALIAPALAEVVSVEAVAATGARRATGIVTTVREIAPKGQWGYTRYYKPFAFTSERLCRDFSDEVIEPGGYEHIRLDEPLYQLEGREAWVSSDRVSEALRTSDTLLPVPRDERVSIPKGIEQASSRRSEAKASYSSHLTGGSKSVPKESTQKKGCQGKTFGPSNGKVTGR